MVGPGTFGSHGGDWEMVEVVLDQGNNPIGVRTTGHTNIEPVAWNQLRLETTHPTLYTEKGGHEAHPSPPQSGPWIVHQTWTGGLATFPGSQPQQVGPLVDLGTRLYPKVRFLRYSGLWGSIGATPVSSGYWGPAFNETGMPKTGFLAAWCDQMDPTDQTHDSQNECFPDDQE
jgi:hypothetical protein